jgi:adenylosuccinate synthase
MDWHPSVKIVSSPPNWNNMRRVFVEVSQGFSLGINSQFYPKVTSRECTVMQAIADARIPAQMVNSVFMVVRTFPIRVGDVDGFSSGDWYPDQEETSWEALGQAEELTTVTKRVRRVATFSNMQFIESLQANMPKVVLVNFMNYIESKEERNKFAMRLKQVARGAMGYEPKFLYGYGPNAHDITTSVR